MLLPPQMVEVCGLIVRVGNGFTTINVPPGPALTQPAELVPVTEYVVPTVGQTTGPPFRYVYVWAPLGVSVVHKPMQTAVGLAATEMVGSGFTVTTTVRIPGQMPVPLLPYAV